MMTRQDKARVRARARARGETNDKPSPPPMPRSRKPPDPVPSPNAPAVDPAGMVAAFREKRISAQTSHRHQANTIGRELEALASAVSDSNLSLVSPQDTHVAPWHPLDLTDDKDFELWSDSSKTSLLTLDEIESMDIKCRGQIRLTELRSALREGLGLVMAEEVQGSIMQADVPCIEDEFDFPTSALPVAAAAKGQFTAGTGSFIHGEASGLGADVSPGRSTRNPRTSRGRGTQKPRACHQGTQVQPKLMEKLMLAEQRELSDERGRGRGSSKGRAHSVTSESGVSSQGDMLFGGVGRGNDKASQAGHSSGSIAEERGASLVVDSCNGHETLHSCGEMVPQRIEMVGAAEDEPGRTEGVESRGSHVHVLSDSSAASTVASTVSPMQIPASVEASEPVMTAFVEMKEQFELLRKELSRSSTAPLPVLEPAPSSLLRPGVLPGEDGGHTLPCEEERETNVNAAGEISEQRDWSKEGGGREREAEACEAEAEMEESNQVDSEAEAETETGESNQVDSVESVHAAHDTQPLHLLDHREISEPHGAGAVQEVLSGPPSWSPQPSSATVAEMAPADRDELETVTARSSVTGSMCGSMIYDSPFGSEDLNALNTGDEGELEQGLSLDEEIAARVLQQWWRQNRGAEIPQYQASNEQSQGRAHGLDQHFYAGDTGDQHYFRESASRLYPGDGNVAATAAAAASRLLDPAVQQWLQHVAAHYQQPVAVACEEPRLQPTGVSRGVSSVGERDESEDGGGLVGAMAHAGAPLRQHHAEDRHHLHQQQQQQQQQNHPEELWQARHQESSGKGQPPVNDGYGMQACGTAGGRASKRWQEEVASPSHGQHEASGRSAGASRGREWMSHGSRAQEPLVRRSNPLLLTLQGNNNPLLWRSLLPGASGRLS
ncbi:unnamed protein product [Chrysoparadoxa australica]